MGNGGRLLSWWGRPLACPCFGQARGLPHRSGAALIALLALAAPAAAAGYGDVDVVLEGEPQGQSTHGYAEVWVRVTNKSEQKPRTVRLTAPKQSYSPGTDHLRAVTRTVTVEPGKTARVSLAYPAKLAVGGSGLGVAVDGREFEDPVPFGGFSTGGMRYGGGYGASPGPRTLVLYSLDVDPRFPDWMRAFGWDPRVGPPPIATSTNHDLVRADRPAAAWSPNWLGYSRYDGVVVTAADLRAMPAEVRAALGQYVECGGSLFALGADAPLPGKWKPEKLPDGVLTAHAAGFGECLVADKTDLTGWSGVASTRVQASWARTAAPWQRDPGAGEANKAFPVIEDVGVPVRGLLLLMFVFVVLIGPVNLYVLNRTKRKLWQFWTVPLASFLTCVGVFGYMALTEGWAGRARAEGFTVLDETSRRAATIGWSAYYTPLLPGGGLHFGTETEVSPRTGDDRSTMYGSRRRGGAQSLTIDWTKDQHLAAGWLTPRVPAHFAVRKGETRRERVTIAAANGRPEAVNGLGADVAELWYADNGGAIHKGGPIPAGGRAALEPTGRTVAPPDKRQPLREVYTGTWPNVVDHVRGSAGQLLAPRTYLAVLDAAPFLDDALPGASVRKARSAVYGILREGGDE